MKKVISFLFVFILLFVVGAFSVEASTVVDNLTITKKTAHKTYFKWNKVDDADKYLLRIVTRKNKKLITKKRTKKNRAVVRGLKSYKKYTAKVKAKVNGKYYKNSDPKKFRTNKGSLYLTGEDYDTTVNWESTLEAESGYKLVWSQNTKPEYPTRSGDKYKYYSDSDTDEGEIDAFSGAGTYYVRVCEYKGGECGKYSNQIAVELNDDSSDDEDQDDEDQENDVESITLSAYEGECNNSIKNSVQIQNSNTCYNVQWEVEGYSANGFKLVWSKNTKPEYPPRGGDDYAYYSNPEQEKGKVTISNGTGTYYVRVCEYLGGACGVYSNQITLDL